MSDDLFKKETISVQELMDKSIYNLKEIEFRPLNDLAGSKITRTQFEFSYIIGDIQLALAELALKGHKKIGVSCCENLLYNFILFHDAERPETVFIKVRSKKWETRKSRIA